MPIGCATSAGRCICCAGCASERSAVVGWDSAGQQQQPPQRRWRQQPARRRRRRRHQWVHRLLDGNADAGPRLGDRWHRERLPRSECSRCSACTGTYICICICAGAGAEAGAKALGSRTLGARTLGGISGHVESIRVERGGLSDRVYWVQCVTPSRQYTPVCVSGVSYIEGVACLGTAHRSWCLPKEEGWAAYGQAAATAC